MERANLSTPPQPGKPQPSPLYFRSQTFPHRYGSATRRETLQTLPLRSKNLKAEPVSPIIETRLPSPPRMDTQDAISQVEPIGSTPYSPRLKRRQSTEPLQRPVEPGKSSTVEKIKHTPRRARTMPIVPLDRKAEFDPDGGKSRIEAEIPIATPETPNANLPEDRGPASSQKSNNLATPQSMNVIHRPREPEKTRETERRLRFEPMQADGQSRNYQTRLIRPGRPQLPQPQVQYRIAVPKSVPFVLYEGMVGQLVEHMPQLVNVRGSDCRQSKSGNVFCYDTLQTGGFRRQQDSIEFSKVSTTDARTRIQNLRPDRVPNVRSRYILIEDLSPPVIEIVGSTFWLNPEFFEEHLNRSGYRGDSYGDPHPRTWNTNATPKDYASVRWFRPVQRTRMKPLSELDRDTLLRKNGGTGSLYWKSDTTESTSRKVMRLTTNIFRQEWPIISNPDEAISDDSETTFPVAWEEKLTVQVSQSSRRPPVYIILMDPLPTLRIETDTLLARSRSAPHDDVVPFTQAYSRAPIGPKLGLIDVFNGNPLSDLTVQMLSANLTSTNCTRTDVTSWLEGIYGVQPENSDMDMMTGLLWIIHRDVIGFLRFVSDVLEEIGLSSTDDYIIQKRLTHWRNLITRFQTELPAMRVSIQSFFEFVSQFQPLEQAKAFIEHTLHLIDDLIVQNEKSYAALRADMALLESKRAIDQAESVGKLTELGFIFIPISCIAALFSMQIQPLETPVPLYSFFIAAAVTIGLIYTVRLSIRSTALIEYKRNHSRNIRVNTKLAPGAPIPTHIFLAYVCRHALGPYWRFLRNSLFFLLVLGITMLPVMLLWTHNKHMDVGYKGTMTFIIFLFDAVVVFPFISNPISRAIFRRVESFAERKEIHDLDIRFGTGKHASKLRKGRKDIPSPSSSSNHFSYHTTSSESSESLKPSKPSKPSKSSKSLKTKNAWQKYFVPVGRWILGHPGRKVVDMESLESESQDSRRPTPKGVRIVESNLVKPKRRGRRGRSPTPVRLFTAPPKQKSSMKEARNETGPVKGEVGDADSAPRAIGWSDSQAKEKPDGGITGVGKTSSPILDGISAPSSNSGKDDSEEEIEGLTQSRRPTGQRPSSKGKLTDSQQLIHEVSAAKGAQNNGKAVNLDTENILHRPSLFESPSSYSYSQPKHRLSTSFDGPAERTSKWIKSRKIDGSEDQDNPKEINGDQEYDIRRVKERDEGEVKSPIQLSAREDDAFELEELEPETSDASCDYVDEDVSELYDGVALVGTDSKTSEHGASPTHSTNSRGTNFTLYISDGESD
ncbi:hypothetical protein K469DRAFT_358467 [Zopfia rhizophila CBS 207.26]|uniref:Uncharacterized protein n=1 Tax=Zopfia rhizophila CBS 207.26 TaxID=1314779 RepID=A0A6A6DGW5_9PEZI|nr:hypothetical protein K469DRAFT_358467 [Zopfia rhizophila CBS 207.26]